jgi:hypothetical protein
VNRDSATVRLHAIERSGARPLPRKFPRAQTEDSTRPSLQLGYTSLTVEDFAPRALRGRYVIEAPHRERPDGPMTKSSVGLLGLAVLTSCGAQRDDSVEATRSSRAASVDLARSTPPSPASTRPSTPETTSPFRVVAVSDRLPRLRPIQGAFFVSAGAKLAEVSGEDLAWTPASASIEVDEIGGLVGHWPIAAWLWGWKASLDRHAPATQQRWDPASKKWSARPVEDPHDGAWNAVAWTRGRVWSGAHWLDGEGPAPKHGTLAAERCSMTLDRVEASAIAGEVLFALGPRKPKGSCLLEHQASAVEVWAGDDKEATLTPLPGPAVPGKDYHDPAYAYRIYARAADDVWVAGHVDSGSSNAPYLARFDGRAWASVPPPPSKLFPIALSGSPDGALWIVTSNDVYGREARDGFDPGRDREEVWRRAPSGDYALAVLPRHPDAAANGDQFHPVDVFVRDDDDVWLTGMFNGNTEFPYALLHRTVHAGEPSVVEAASRARREGLP